MPMPSLSAGMKELDDLARVGINPAQIWAFMKIALVTSKGQIALFVAPTVLFWGDMLDMERHQRSPFLRQLAILAPAAGAPAHQIT
jgi:hypothetical protein